jgi:hypothetical protein
MHREALVQSRRDGASAGRRRASRQHLC